MGIQVRIAFFIAVMFLIGILPGCTKEQKTGSVEITGQELVLRQDGENSFVLDARGKVKNVGTADVKTVVITGYCRSCQEIFTNGKWFVSEYEKTSDQKDIISYLSPGVEESFEFKGIAFYFTQTGTKPETLPENVQIVIETFETVQ